MGASRHILKTFINIIGLFACIYLADKGTDYILENHISDAVSNFLFNEDNRFSFTGKPHDETIYTWGTMLFGIPYVFGWCVWAKLVNFNFKSLTDTPPYKVMAIGLVVPALATIAMAIEGLLEYKGFFLAEATYRAVSIGSAALFEEVLFRGIAIGLVYKFLIIDYNKQHLTKYLILLSGLVFGIVHMTNALSVETDILGASIQSLSAAIGGWGFALLYIITGKLRYSIGLHFTYNFLLIFAPFKNEWTDPLIEFYSNIPLVAIILGSVIVGDTIMTYFLYKIWKRKQLND